MSAVKRPYRTLVIRTAKGPLEGTFQMIDPLRVIAYVQGSSTAYPVGTVFDRNRGIENTSPNGTAWAAHESVYDAHRAALMKMRNLGPDRGEIAELLDDGRRITDYLDMLLRLSVLGAEETANVTLRYRSLLGRLKRARTPRKKRAYEDLARASYITDSRGRRNPGAAAMAAYAGKYQERLRVDDVRSMLPYMDARAIRIHAYLMDTVRAYEALLDLLGSRHRTPAKHGPEIWAFTKDPTPASRTLAVKRLREQIDVFRDIRALPFLKNVHHLRDDLAEAHRMVAMRAIERSEFGVDLFRNLLFRIREGATWALALHALEMEIRTPLSLLVGDLRMQRRAKRAVAGDDVETVTVDAEQAPERFAEIGQRIHRFRRRVDRCSDAHLKHPVKRDVLDRIDEILRCVDDDGDWITAREELDILAGIL